MEVNVRKRGKYYEYRFETATVSGCRKWTTQSGFKTRKQAEMEGTKAYYLFVNKGRVKDITDMSVSDFLDYWIKNYAEINLKYNTIQSYLNIIKIHLKPRLGSYKLSQVDTELLQITMNQLFLENNYSKWYLASILKVIKGSFKYACYGINFINDDPAEHVHCPKSNIIEKDPVHIFTDEEISTILKRFKDNRCIYCALLTAYYTGLRISEVFGLTWDNIDFENKTLTVNKIILKKNQKGLPHKKCITKGHTSTVWYFGTPKTKTSNRTIIIGDKLLEVLRKFKKEQEEQRKEYGDSYELHYQKEVVNPYTNKPEIKIISVPKELKVDMPEANLIFIKENGYFLGTDATKHTFKVIHYELGINCRFHDFRDTHATRLVEAGADIKSISKRLGHSTIQTTYNIYVRVTNKMESDTANKFEELSQSLNKLL